MGNTSRRKPKPTPREPGGAPVAKPAPPRFAVVRHVTAGVSRIDVVNLDHVAHAVAHVYGEEHAIELWTLADLAGDYSRRLRIDRLCRGAEDPYPITFTGDAAVNLLAHLILCGIDVEGAPAALARARGDLYAPYFKGTATSEPEPVELPDPIDAADPGACRGCAFEFVEPCAGWIPGGLDDECGAFEAAADDAPPISDCREAYDRLAAAVSMSECAPPPAPPLFTGLDCVPSRSPLPVLSPNNRDDCAHVNGCEHWRRGLGCTVPNFDDCPKLKNAPTGPPWSIEEQAAELAAIRASSKLAISEIHAGEVDAEIRALDDAEHSEETRAACAFGASCKRFPACGDCSLYALDRACVDAHDGAHLVDPAADRRVVHVEHVEQVSGEKAAALLKRVERCGVFLGLKGRGVVPGDQWCGVGHEMIDPACALCPYLRIYAPAL